jgi:hypothetical protein
MTVHVKSKKAPVHTRLSVRMPACVMKRFFAVQGIASNAYQVLTPAL